MQEQDIRDKHAAFLFPCVANYYAEPVILTKAQGAWATDIRGRSYLDFFGGILTVSLGHCQPEVVDAVADQMSKLGHVSTLYPTENIVKVAETLARLAPGALTKSFFTNSGTEANETAIMLAKLYTGEQEIIALRHCYAGRSALGTSLTGHGSWRPLSTQVAGIKHAPAPYCYRCPMGLTYPSCDLRCAKDLEELIQTETGGRPAALMAEPILGVGGFITPPPEYFQVAVGIVRAHGGLFICDEVQTGFGRTGDHWFGIEHFGVEPDVMTMAKGIANGLPVGNTMARPEVADCFEGLTISTFGGNPVAMAATDATLKVMQREDIPAQAARKGRLLREHLQDMYDTYPCIGEVRGKGLMMALELVEDRDSKQPAPEKVVALLQAAKDEELLLGKGGLYGNVVRIAPPMLIDDEALHEGCRRLRAALGRV